MSRSIPNSWARTRPGTQWLFANGARPGYRSRTPSADVSSRRPATACCFSFHPSWRRSNARAERNAALLEDKRILYRIGVKFGDVLIEGDDLGGGRVLERAVEHADGGADGCI